MRKVVHKRSIALLVAGLLVFAGIGAVTHTLDHAGKPTDVVCSFCISAAHGKAPSPALAIDSSAAPSASWCVTDAATPIISHSALAPPVRAAPLEVAA